MYLAIFPFNMPFINQFLYLTEIWIWNPVTLMADDNLLWIQAVDKPYQCTRQFLCHFGKDPIHILLSFGKCIPFTFLDCFIHFLAKSGFKDEATVYGCTGALLTAVFEGSFFD